jgi:hypothetical protein
MEPKGERKDWRELARRAANEHDSDKLLALVEELNAVLVEQENELRRRIPSRAGEPAPQREIGRSLLFIDDEPSIRLTLPPLLQEHGFQVKVAANVPEALEAIKTNEFDVLICDLLGGRPIFRCKNLNQKFPRILCHEISGETPRPVNA